MAFSPGKYTVANVHFGNFACLPTSNHDQHVVSIINPDSESHQWYLKSSPQGLYSIQNVKHATFGSFLSIAGPNPREGSEITVIDKEAWWTIERDSEGNCWICPAGKTNLSWSMPYLDDGTPIKLDRANHDSRCLWKILPLGSEMVTTSGSDMVPGPLPSQDELDELNKLTMAGLNYELPRKGFMEGTRGDILRRIDDWMKDFTVPNILWIKGYPGVGKSAIATEVVDRLIAVKRLGSAFFFQRQNTALNPKALWRKVSYDLSKKHFPIRNIVLARLKATEISPDSSHLDRIFRYYVHEPLLTIKEIPETQCPVVVIDALDECGGLEGQTSEDREILLKNIQSWSSLPSKFKLIITSRGEGDIERIFSETSHHPIEISAGQMVDSHSSDDIRKFLQNQFSRIAARFPKAFSNTNWPDKQMIEQMVIMAAGLFIWAETIIKFISLGDHRRRLQQVLQGGIDGSLVNLYKQVLDSSFSKATAEGIEEFRSIVGTIILAKVPISFTSLSAFRFIEEFNVENICSGLQPVLEFQNIVRFSHQSFVDFLLDQTQCPPQFFIDLKRENQKLTLACFRVMREGLRFNICGIESSYMRNSDIPNLESRAERDIQPHLRYASYHWESHLVATTSNEEVFEYLRDFMENLFLFWLEVLSITRTMNQSSLMLLSCINWIRIQACHRNNLLGMAVDMQKFVGSFTGVMSQSAAHIYLSALPFVPSNSVVAKRYAPEYSNTISIEIGGLKTWPVVQNVLTGHEYAVCSVEFSPNGRHIVSGSFDETIRIWDTETGKMVTGPLKGHTDYVNSVAFSPDGRRVVSGSEDNTIRIWDAQTGEMVTGPLNGHTESVCSVTFSPDGSRVVSGSRDNTIRIWYAQTGETVTGPLNGHKDSVNSVAFSPDGRRIVSGSSDNTIRIWDVTTGKMGIGPLKGHRDDVRSVAFSPDGGRFVSGSDDNTIRIWDAKTGKLVTGPLKDHTSSALSVAFSPDGRRVVSGSGDKTIRIWDAETGKLVTSPLSGHESVISSVKFSPDGRRLVSGSYDRTIRIWDAEVDESAIGPLNGHEDCVHSVSFSPDGRRIVSGSEDETIRIWDAETGELVIGPLNLHEGGVKSVAFSPDGKCVVSGSSAGKIRLWDAETGKMIVGPLKGHKDAVRSVSFSPDGRRIVSGSSDNTIRIWDAKAGKMDIGPLKGHRDDVRSVAFSPDGGRFVSGSDDNTIRIWDAKTGKTAIGPLNCHDSFVMSVAFSPDGRRVVSGSWDNTIRIWDAETGDMVTGPLKGHTDYVNSVAFSPDGRRVVSGSDDRTVRIWDTQTGEMITGPLKGHEGAVTSVTFSPDGRRVASASADKMIRIWNVQTHVVSTSPPEQQNQSIESVGIHSEKETVVSDPMDLISRSRCSDADSFEAINSLIPFFDDSCSMVDGWILGQNAELLFWVPPDLRSGLLRPNNTLIIGTNPITKLDLTSFTHGKSWAQCKARKPFANEDLLDTRVPTVSLSPPSFIGDSLVGSNMDHTPMSTKREASRKFVHTLASGLSKFLKKGAGLEEDTKS